MDIYRVVIIVECESGESGEIVELMDHSVAWAVKDEDDAVRFKDDLVAHGVALMNNEDYGQFVEEGAPDWVDDPPDGWPDYEYAEGEGDGSI